MGVNPEQSSEKRITESQIHGECTAEDNQKEVNRQLTSDSYIRASPTTNNSEHQEIIKEIDSGIESSKTEYRATIQRENTAQYS